MKRGKNFRAWKTNPFRAVLLSGVHQLNVSVKCFRFYTPDHEYSVIPLKSHSKHLGLSTEIIVFPCVEAATANGDFLPKSIIFRPEGVDWWETLPHAPRCEVVSVRLSSRFHATHRFCSLIREIPTSCCFGRTLASPNEYSGENTDGWTD